MTPIERFWKDKNNTKYDTYLLGMSHSVNGIIEALLPGNTYKFSAPSMDLYYYRLVINELDSRGMLRFGTNVIFELPYYAFNYDISKTRNTFLLRQEFFDYFNDYHNFPLDRLKEKKIAEETTNMPRIPARALKKVYMKLRYTLIRKPHKEWTPKEIEGMANLHPHVWYDTYSDTIRENQAIWSEILSLLSGKRVNVQVIVMPFHSGFISAHEKSIAHRKEEFYRCISSKEIRVRDHFSISLVDDACFDDECHLNIRGAWKYTKYLRKELAYERHNNKIKKNIE